MALGRFSVDRPGVRADITEEPQAPGLGSSPALLPGHVESAPGDVAGRRHVCRRAPETLEAATRSRRRGTRRDRARAPRARGRTRPSAHTHAPARWLKNHLPGKRLTRAAPAESLGNYGICGM